MKHFILGALIASALSIVGFVAPASAQASRTWVSGVGDDANPCSRTAPCKTFAGAISKTAQAGEINCIDAGGFGTLTITKSITINCAGTMGSVLASGTPGFTVNAATTDLVIIENLEVEGIASGTTGVNVINAQAVILRNCDIRHFTGVGVNINSANATRVMVENCAIVNNAGGGVNVASASGNNSASVLHSFVDGNGPFALQVTGNASNSIAYSWSTLSNSTNAINNLSGSQVVSFGPSSILTGGGAPTSTQAFK